MNFGKYALLALAGVSLLAFTSCKKDEKKPAPSIKVNYGNNELKGDATAFPLIVIATPADEVKGLSFVVKYKNAEGNDATQDSKKISGKKETLGYTGEIKETDLPTGIKEGTIIITAEGPDAKSTKEVKYNLSGTPNPTPNPSETGWTGTTREGALNHKTSNEHPNSAFDLKAGSGLKIREEGKEGNRYMMNTTKGSNEFKAEFTSEKIDFYKQDGTVEKSFKGNGCEFTKVTGLDFDKATATEAAAKFVAGTKTLAVNEGDIVVAKKGDELYLLKITKISKTGGRAGQGYMTFSYKTKK